MGFRRALLLAGMGLWGVGALTAPAGAHPPADDYVPYQPSGFFVFNWSGFYAGGNLGLAHANLSADEQIFPDDFFSADILVFNGDSNEQSQTSITGGVQVGWQNHWGKVVWGVEAGISLLRFDNTSESPVIVGLSRSAEVTDFLSLTGRLGYADGRWLAYIKGGLVNAEISVDYRDAFTGLSSSSSNRETGWTAGLGIDYALGPNLFLGIEYNFMHFNIDVHPPLLPDLPTKFGDAELDIQNIVVRLNHRFQPGCCLPPGGP